MQFIHQPLTWCFFLVLAPLLIHLINLMRHRRVKWAAMEFVLKSYKKNRRWVWLRQLVLLLLRMVVIACIVAMLARLITRQQWSSVFSSRTIHHIVLLDDSYSMSQQDRGTTVFDEAEQAIRNIATIASNDERRQHRLTLIRFSQARKAASSGMLARQNTSSANRGQQEGSPDHDNTALIADLNGVFVNDDIDVLLEEQRRGFDVTELAVGPEAALTVAAELAEADSDDERDVYVVSDFRATTWNVPEKSRQLMSRLNRAGATVHLIRCVEQPKPNLAITRMEPADGTLAAQVPLFVDITITNFSAESAEQVPVKVRSVYYRPPAVGANPESTTGDSSQLPTLVVDRIPAGQSVSRRVQVLFPGPGTHTVEAELPNDAIAADNRRWCVIDLPAAVPVLIVDGSDEQQESYFLKSIFQQQTGIDASIKSPAFLRDSQTDALAEFRAIYLLDVRRLDRQTTKKLDSYVQSGGGLSVFVGENLDLAAYNQWFEEGAFPVKLDGTELVDRPVTDASDFNVEEHPIFRVLLGENNLFLRALRVGKYMVTEDEAPIREDARTSAIARLANGDPLVLERTHGQGNIVVFLTTFSPRWNNWARQPSFVVMVLELHAYLDAGNSSTPTRLVGTPIHYQLDQSQIRADVDFVLPGTGQEQRRVIRRQAEVPVSRSSESPDVLVASLGAREIEDGTVPSDETDRSGVYELWMTRIDGEVDTKRFALNVDNRESDLAVIDTTQMLSKLGSVDVQIHGLADIAARSEDNAGFSWSQVLLFGLVGLLLTEQAVAYSAGYHPPRGGRK